MRKLDVQFGTPAVKIQTNFEAVLKQITDLAAAETSEEKTALWLSAHNLLVREFDEQ